MQTPTISFILLFYRRWSVRLTLYDYDFFQSGISSVKSLSDSVCLDSLSPDL